MMDMAVGLSMGQMMSQNMAQMAPNLQAPQQQAPATESVADRLKKLKDLKEGGLIDEAAFAAKRDAILAEI
jgi:membrane protease subunit (stomatin/prohibitin family)